MNTRLNDVESTQQSLVTNQRQLTECVECNETMITEAHERLGTMATANTVKSVARKKNIKSASGIESKSLLTFALPHAEDVSPSYSRCSSICVM